MRILKRKKRVFLFTSFVRSFISLVRHSIAALIVVVTRANSVILSLCEYFYSSSSSSSSIFFRCMSTLDSTQNVSIIIFPFFCRIHIAFDDVRSCTAATYLLLHFIVRRLSSAHSKHTKCVLCLCLWTVEVAFFFFFCFFASAFFFSLENTLVLHLEFVFKMIMYYCCLIICVFILNK